ncbi:MAG: class I poly(R)-hydroxyalkanoic acid synthase [Parvularculaceae bacterium]
MNGSTKPATAADAKSLYEDFDALSSYLTDITGTSQDVVREFFVKNADMMNVASGTKSADPLNVGESFQEMLNALSADPGTVMQRQFNLWGDYAKLMATMSRRMSGEKIKAAIDPEPGDRRFAHAAWTENPMLDFVKQAYLTYAKWLKNTVSQLDGMDEHDKKKAEFFTQQFIDALSPTNFPVFNPEVVEATIESKGENLLKGMRNLLEDIDRGHGSLSIRQADLDHFKLGENIATTPGKVVYQNEIMQVIQYDPVTENVAKRPLLIFPPWINKFYILDLQPANSFIRWAVEQGRTVFVVSWVNPGPELKNKTFEDYIKQGCFEALDAVRMATGEEDVDAIGYCIGGTMLSTALALMARRNDTRIKTATFFTAQADFKESGDLLLFVDDAQLGAIEKQMDAAGGVLEGRAMATTFNMLRSNDLIWSFVIDNYMKGKDPAKFDLLFWNSDATRMPKNVHLFYLREFYQHNRLAMGEMVIDGEKLDLSEVNIPIFMQAGETDHIAPHNSVYRTARLYASKDNRNVTYMLAGSGHIAGVVNHPLKNKYHHSVNESLPSTLDEWKNDATRQPGSWWPYWIEWLNEVSPDTVPARWPGDGELPAIEAAPGSYVKVKA